jgi:hypothetical protein
MAYTTEAPMQESIQKSPFTGAEKLKNRIDLKEEFGKDFPWHYDPMLKDHDDAPNMGNIVFDYESLCEQAIKLCTRQGDPKHNNRGFSYYLNDNLEIDPETFKDRDVKFKKLMSLWQRTRCNADNSCYWEFHDDEIGDLYSPLLETYKKLYPFVDKCQIRVVVKPPMSALTMHADTYGTYSRKYSVSKDQVFRVLTFCEDWQWGHYFLLGNHVCHQYRAGDSFRVKPDVWHMTANMGVNPKISMTFTGVDTRK